MSPAHFSLAVLTLSLAVAIAATSRAPAPEPQPTAASQNETPASEAPPVRFPTGITNLDRLRQEAQAVIAELAANRDGEVYSGAVEGTVPDDFAISVVLADGRGFSVGNGETRFPLMSVSKPFSYALAVEQRGLDFMIERIGVIATGFPYNAVAAGAVRPTTRQNPLVNAGAIATHSFIQGADSEAKIGAIVDLYSALAGAELAIDEDWRTTPRALTYTLAYQMLSEERLEGDVEDVAERYLEACIVGVTVQALAQMGATLANGGVQPVSGRRVLSEETVRAVLSVMTVAGMYEDSGRWWTRVGLPAKSGVSGAILAVVPGWGAIVAYSPRLDPAGNSVRGALAIRALSERWRLHTMDRLLSGADG